MARRLIVTKSASSPALLTKTQWYLFALLSIVKQGNLLSSTLQTPDYVEATVFNRDEAVVMVGHFANVKNAKEESQVNHITRWYKPWFYKHVESFLIKGRTVEYIPLREYLLRHNRAIFWVVADMIPFGNHPLFR